MIKCKLWRGAWRKFVNQPTVRFPVKCPQCGVESIGVFRVSDIAEGLIGRRKIQLYANCHARWWAASDDEQHRIREYLGDVWLNNQRDIIID
jgi:hypothetical protein